MYQSIMMKLLYTIFIFVCWSVEHVELSTPKIYSNFHCYRNIEEYDCNWALYDSPPTALNVTYETTNKLTTVVSTCKIFTDEHSRPTGGFDCSGLPDTHLTDHEYLRFNFTAEYDHEIVHQSFKIHYCALYELPALKDLRVANASESSVYLQWRISSNISSTDWDYHINAYGSLNELIAREVLTSAQDEIGYTFADLEPDTEYEFAVTVRSPISWNMVFLDEDVASKMNCSRNAFRHPDDHEWSEPANVTTKTQPIPSLPGSFMLQDVDKDARSVRVYWAPKRGALRCKINVHEGAASIATGLCPNEGQLSYTIPKERIDFEIVHVGHEGWIYHRQLVVVPEQNSIIEQFPSVLVRESDSPRSYKLFWRIPSVPELSNFTVYLRRNGSTRYELVEYRESSSNSTVYLAEAEDPPLNFAISANTATSSSGLVTPKCIVPYDDGIPAQISVQLADLDSNKVNISALHCSEVNAIWNIRSYALIVCNLNSTCKNSSKSVHFIADFSTDGRTISVPDLRPNTCFGFYLQTFFKHAKSVVPTQVAKLCVPNETSNHTENSGTHLDLGGSGSNLAATIISIALLLVGMVFAGVLFVFLFERHRNTSYRLNELDDTAIYAGDQKMGDDFYDL